MIYSIDLKNKKEKPATINNDGTSIQTTQNWSFLLLLGLEYDRKASIIFGL